MECLDWIGLVLLSGTDVATALWIVQWPTLFLTMHLTIMHILRAK